MRTFTTNVAAGIAGDSEPIGLIKISPSSVAPADTWSTFRWGTRAIDFGSGENYLGGVIRENGIGDMNMGVNLEKGGNKAYISDFSLKIANAQYSGDTRFDEYVATNSIYFENRKIELLMIFADKTPLDWANVFVVWTGIIEEAYPNSYGEFVFECVDSTWSWDRPIPQTVIETKNYPNVHKDNVGKVVPITFGDMDYALGRCVGTLLGAQNYLFDTEEVKQFGDVYVHDKDYNTFPKVCATQEDGTGGPEYLTSTALAWISFGAATNPFAEKGLLVLWDFFLLDSVISSTFRVTDPEKVFDGNLATYARFDVKYPSSAASDFIPRAAVTGAYDAYADARYRIAQTHASGEPRRLCLVAKVDMPVGWVDADDQYFWVQVNPDAPNSFVGGGLDGGNNYNNYSKEIHAFLADFDNWASPTLAIDLIANIFGSSSGSGTSRDAANVRWKRDGWGTIENGWLVFGGFWQNATNQDFVVDVYEAKLLVVATVRFEKLPHLYCELEGRVF